MVARGGGGHDTHFPTILSKPLALRGRTAGAASAMEGFEALEAAMSMTATGPAAASEGASSSGGGQDSGFAGPTVTPAKRRRTSGLRGLVGSVKQELDDNNSGNGLATPSSAASPSGTQRSTPLKAIKEESAGPKTCLGCGRSRGSPCWIDPSSTICWAHSNDRGHWCRACHNCFRCVFAETSSLQFFGQQLKEPHNFEDWEEKLIAYGSLCKEGIGRIMIGTVQDGSTCSVGWATSSGTGTPIPSW